MSNELNEFILNCVNRTLRKFHFKVDCPNSLPLRYIEA